MHPARGCLELGVWDIHACAEARSPDYMHVP